MSKSNIQIDARNEPERNDLMPLEHYQSLAALEHSYFWHTSRRIWAASIIKRFIPAPTSGMSVLDFGCGTGGFLHAMQQALCFRKILGVDASSCAIASARAYGDHYEVIPAESFGSSEAYDFVFLMDVLEHIQDDRATLRTLLSTLAPGGHILLSVPAHQVLFSEWDARLGHFRRYSKASLQSAAEDAGGEVVYSTYAFSYLFPAVLLRLAKSEGYENQCEFPPVSAFLNKTLIALARTENALARYLPIPFGTSVFCLLRKAH